MHKRLFLGIVVLLVALALCPAQAAVNKWIPQFELTDLTFNCPTYLGVNSIGYFSVTGDDTDNFEDPMTTADTVHCTWTFTGGWPASGNSRSNTYCSHTELGSNASSQWPSVGPKTVLVSLDDCGRFGTQSDDPGTRSKTMTVTIVDVNLGTDSDNDGDIDANDDPTEMMPPGRYLGHNTITGESDLAQVNMGYMPTGGVNNLKLKLDASTGATKIRVWTSTAKTTEIVLPKTYTIGVDSIPSQFYVEGIVDGDVVLVATLMRPDSSYLIADNIKMTVAPKPCTPVVTDDGVFTNDNTKLHATWTSPDAASVAEYKYCIGKTAGAADVVGWKTAGTVAAMNEAIALAENNSYYVSVKARYATGPWSNVGTSDGIMVDTIPPSIEQVTSTSADNTLATSYGLGDQINVSVVFDEPVIVTGSPEMLMELNGPDLGATYDSTDGNTVAFTYTVKEGDYSLDLDYSRTDSFALYGGATVKDAAGNQAVLQLPMPGAEGSLSANKQLVVRGNAGPSNVIYVAPDGNDMWLGMGWDAPKQTIQAGIDAAEAGCEVWVLNDDVNSYNECVTLKAGVKLYGGFDGNETDKSQRRPGVRSFITGDGLDSSVITVAADALPTDTLISGFMIRCGKGTAVDEGGNTVRYGGGIYCLPGSSPTIAGNYIVSNVTINSGTQYIGTTPGYAYKGAGIYCSQSSARIINNIIAGNGFYGISGTTQLFWGEGGGIYANSVDTHIVNNTICRNVAINAKGPAVYVTGSGATVANNIVDGNYSNGAVAGICSTGTGHTVRKNNFDPGSNATYPSSANDWDTPAIFVAGNNNLYNFSTPITGVDFHLDSNASTAGLYIDAGSESDVEAGYPDMDGEVRIGDCSKFGGNYHPWVDIGADEYWTFPTVVKVSLNADQADPDGVYSQGEYVNIIVEFSEPMTITGNPRIALALDGGTSHYATYSYSLDGGKKANFYYTVQSTDRTFDLEYANGWIDPNGGRIATLGNVPLMAGMPAPYSPGSLSWTSDIVIRTPETAITRCYVKPTGNNQNSGTSWANALKTVQAGINAIGSAGGEVWVLNDSVNSYNECVTLKAGVKLYGGFDGTETDKSQRRSGVRSIITGDGLDSSVITVAANALPTNTVISGFTIRGGKGTAVTEGSNTVRYGGGIYCLSGSSPTIAGNYIVSNVNINGSQYIGTTPGYAYKGAGIYCSVSSARIINNVIAGNGFYGLSGVTEQFWGTGGGIYAGNSVDTHIVNNTICRNVASASSGAGVYLSGNGATVSNNIVDANYSNAQYSGIYSTGTGHTIRKNNFAPGSNATYPSSANDWDTPAIFVAGNNNLYNFSTSIMGVDFHIDYNASTAGLYIDAGNESDVEAGYPDMDGEVRIGDCSKFGGSYHPWVDIGADEYWPIPTVVSVKGNPSQCPDGVYTQGQYVNVIVEFSEPVTVTGNPRIALELDGGTTHYATYNYSLAGNKQANFYYTVQSTDRSFDLEYASSVIDLNGGTIKSAGNVAALTVMPAPYSPNSLSWNSNIVVQGTTIPGVARAYVKPTGDNNNTGTSWASALKSVQAGINAIASTGGEVWVAGSASQPYKEFVTLKSGVKLYGGFVGNESTADARRPAQNVTILDGDKCTCSVVTIPSNITGNANEISGFTIKNGAGSNGSTNNASKCGGAIFFEAWTQSSAQVTIGNNVITNNSAQLGGGIYLHCINGVIHDNVITNNAATTDSGGGIYLLANGPGTRVVNNTIVNGTAAIYGGAIFMQNGSGWIINNIVANNNSGIYQYDFNGGFHFKNNCFYGNQARHYEPMAPYDSRNDKIDVNPMFVGGSNYHLQSTSQCIGGGDNSEVWFATDMDDQYRINGVVDIGADEYYAP